MSPNVMLGHEWVHSIAVAVINLNAAAAPPMSKLGHCITALEAAKTHLRM